MACINNLSLIIIHTFRRASSAANHSSHGRGRLGNLDHFQPVGLDSVATPKDLTIGALTKVRNQQGIKDIN